MTIDEFKKEIKKQNIIENDIIKVIWKDDLHWYGKFEWEDGIFVCLSRAGFPRYDNEEDCSTDFRIDEVVSILKLTNFNMGNFYN